MSLKNGDKRGSFLTKLADRQAKMRDRLTGSEEIIEQSSYNSLLPKKFKRPKEMCPICLSFHLEEIPDSCWKVGLKGSILQQFEFAKYLAQNKKGRII